MMFKFKLARYINWHRNSYSRMVVYSAKWQSDSITNIHSTYHWSVVSRDRWSRLVMYNVIGQVNPHAIPTAEEHTGRAWNSHRIMSNDNWCHITPHPPLVIMTRDIRMHTLLSVIYLNVETESGRLPDCSTRGCTKSFCLLQHITPHPPLVIMTRDIRMHTLLSVIYLNVETESGRLSDCSTRGCTKSFCLLQ